MQARSVTALVMGVVVLCGLAGACWGDPADISADAAQAVGVYALGSVNGKAPPAALPDEPAYPLWGFFLDSASFELGRDGTFADRRSLRVTPSTGSPYSQQRNRIGTWRELGFGRFELTYSGEAAGMIDTLESDRALLIKTEQNATLIYTR